MVRKIDENEVVIGGKPYTVSPLPFGAMEDLLFPFMERSERELEEAKVTDQQAPGDGLSKLKGYFADMSQIIHASLKIRHPDLTIQEVKDGLDMFNCRDILATIMEVSGLKPGGAMPGGKGGK